MPSEFWKMSTPEWVAIRNRIQPVLRDGGNRWVKDVKEFMVHMEEAHGYKDR